MYIVYTLYIYGILRVITESSAKNVLHVRGQFIIEKVGERRRERCVIAVSGQRRVRLLFSGSPCDDLLL